MPVEIMPRERPERITVAAPVSEEAATPRTKR